MSESMQRSPPIVTRFGANGNLWELARTTPIDSIDSEPQRAQHENVRLRKSRSTRHNLPLPVCMALCFLSRSASPLSRLFGNSTTPTRRATPCVSVFFTASSLRAISSSSKMASMSSSAAAAPSSSGGRTYSDAIDALNTLQSNAAVIAAIRASGGKLNDFAIPEMVEYLKRIGYSVQDLDRLNIIHITGTKGKGSTAAFSSSLLLAALKGHSTDGEQDKRSLDAPKVGLYTSPHMMLVRERIRLDGLPVNEERFAKEFWHVWDRLGETADQRENPSITPVRPVYFRFLTILAFHIFLNTPSLEAVVLEVGIGGKYDSTNLMQHPVACGVCTLGLDHTALLGNTIEEIAGQKAGIYKRGSPAISVAQPKRSAEQVLEKTAQDVGASSFTLLPAAPQQLQQVPLGLPGPHQVTNAHLALSLVDTFLQTQNSTKSVWEQDQRIAPWSIQALSEARWPGRCQAVPLSSSTIFYLDGAHTTDSLSLCASWFTSTTRPSAKRTLIFNCTNGRSARELLQAVLDVLVASEKCDGSDYQTVGRSFFSQLLFCTNTTYKSGSSSGDMTSKAVDPADLEAMSVQRELQAAWKELTAHDDHVKVLPSIEDAMDVVEQNGNEQDVLVAGSLHLVGGVMSHLKDRGALDDKLEAVHERK